MKIKKKPRSLAQEKRKRKINAPSVDMSSDTNKIKDEDKIDLCLLWAALRLIKRQRDIEDEFFVKGIPLPKTHIK